MPEYHWYTSPVIITAIVVGLGLQALIALRLPKGMHILRTHAFFGGVGALMTLLGHMLPWMGPIDGVDVLSELVKVGWGILFIRIVCIAVFRIAMPALGAGQARILHEIVFFSICIGWIMVRLRGAGMELGGIVTTSAALTAILAFAMQETLGNILGGLALQADNSVKLGDWIAVENVRGKVVEVRWRYTALLTAAGEMVVLPNSLLMKAKVTVVSSASFPTARRSVGFAVPNTIAPHEVIAAVEQALRGTVMTHVAHTPAPDCVAADYSGGVITYAVRYWLLDQLHDAAADSVVRLHIYSVLQRNDFPLARPLMDVRMEADPDGRSEAARAEETARRVAVLANVPLFSTLQDDELTTIAGRLKVTPFLKNDVMTRQGAVAHWLYVLTSGEADVWYEDAAGARSLVGSIAPGEVFGEMGMMTGAPRAATVAARSDAVCYRIDKACFEGVLRARPALAEELAALMAARQAALDAVRAAQGRKTVDADDAALLARIRRFFHLPG